MRKKLRAFIQLKQFTLDVIVGKDVVVAAAV